MNSYSNSIKSTTLVFVLWSAGLGAAMQFAKIGVPFVQIKEQYPTQGSEIGLLVSALGLLGIIFGLFAGLIVAHFGFRRLLLSALVLGALMSIYQATLPFFGLMLLSRLIEGISHLIIVVAAPTLIAKNSSDQYRGLAMALWSTFFGVAFALVAWIGMPLVKSYGIESLFVVHANLMLFTAAVLAILLPKQSTSDTGKLRLNFMDILQEHVRAYRSPYIAAPAIGWFFLYAYLCFVANSASRSGAIRRPHLRRWHNADCQPCGLNILRGVFVITIVGDKFDNRGVFIATGVVQLLWMDIDKSWVCIALLGVLGIVQSASFAAIPQLNPDTEAQARANGAMAQMGNLGNTIGTPLMLIVLMTFGLNAMILGVSVCYGAAILFHIWMKQRRHTE
jgi:DHA1 family inner membrane transport protein